jgi:hypothetical protein
VSNGFRELVDAGKPCLRRGLHGARGHVRQRTPGVIVLRLFAARQRVRERGPQRVDFGADGQGLPFEQLRCCELGGEPANLRPAFAPRGRQPEVHQRSATGRTDDEVGRLDVAVKEPGAMNGRELLGGAHQPLEPRAIRRSLQHLFEALPLDQFTDEETTSGPVLHSKGDHARQAEPFEAAQRHRFADERLGLRRPCALGQNLERQRRERDAVANRPNLTAPPFSQSLDAGVPRRNSNHLPAIFSRASPDRSCR